MSREAMKLALEALEMYLLETNSQFQRSAVTALREALAEQPAQPYPNNFIHALMYDVAKRDSEAQQQEPVDKSGSPCPEFWDWLPKAYNFEGLGNFTKYNMEVAFLAGKQSVPAQEPVAWKDRTYGNLHHQDFGNSIPLYTSPQPCLTCEALARTVMLDQTSHDAQRTWVGLTDCEREKLRSEADEADAGYRKLIKATEAKLREKNV